MFLEKSRYHRVPTAEITSSAGRTMRIVKLRRLPATTGAPTEVKEHDRLDLIAQRRYDDPTRFWHVADANTELDACALTREPGRLINVPEQP